MIKGQIIQWSTDTNDKRTDNTMVNRYK
jgi:hypothetical protein